MSYHDVVAEIEARGIMPDRAPSLEPMKLILGRLGILPKTDPDRVIVVAGTNGKGSICAALEALLLSAGKSVGLYTSPHLVETTERIRINGRDVSREEFRRLYGRVCEATHGLSPTHFETLTAMAAWRFFSGEERPAVDWGILEVGLGGTWDATNAVPHSRCVIASLGKDHENLLGSSLSEIAASKFGIVTGGSLVVHSPLPKEVLRLARKARTETGSRWVEAAPFRQRIAYEGSAPHFAVETPWGAANLALPGRRGAQNAATALTAFQELGFDPRAHLGALERIRWPGRMERFSHPRARCPVYLSGDHNPQGVASLLEMLPYYRRKHLHVIAGVGKDKDLEGILGPLFDIPGASVYLTETPFRGRSLAEYGAWLSRARRASADPVELFDHVAVSASPEDCIVITGSLYLVGEIKRRATSAG